MSRLRVEDGAGMTALLGALADRTVVPFASTAERDQQWPNPPMGAMCCIGGVFYGYTGAAWTAFSAAAGGGSFVRIVRTVLTDKTTWAGTGDEQWGTEFATLDDALLPSLVNVTASAEVVGATLNHTNTNSMNIRVDLSFDGGATWDVSGMPNVVRVNPAENALARAVLAASHSRTGTVTGDIRARAIGQNAVGAAFPLQMTRGVLTMTVQA